jgi:hypothetical protein
METCELPYRKDRLEKPNFSSLTSGFAATETSKEDRNVEYETQAAMFVVPTLSTLALYLALPQLVRYPLLRTVNRPEFP